MKRTHWFDIKKAIQVALIVQIRETCKFRNDKTMRDLLQAKVAALRWIRRA